MAENEQVEPEVDDAEMMQQLREELKSLTVADHLLFMMHSLSALAVDRMGLTEQAGGRRDLDEARLAIDAFKALLDLLGTTRPPEEMAAHRSVLSQLQMSYVAMLGRDEAEEEASGEAADKPSGGPAEATAEAPTASAAEADTEAAAAAADGSSTEAPTEAPTGPASEAAAETASETPAESSKEAPGELATDEPVDEREHQD